MQYGPGDAGTDERAQHLAAIIEHANTAVISHTLEGTITSWNSAAERAFGYKPAEMLGNSSWVLVPADRIEDERGILQRVTRGEVVPPWETQRVRKTGQRFSVRIALSRILTPDRAGELRVTGVSQIVGELERRGDSREADPDVDRDRLFANMQLDYLPGIVYLYTEQGRFLRWSQSFERVSGYSRAEIGRMTPLDFFTPEHRALVHDRIQAVLRDGTSQVEAPFLAKDGRATPYHFTGQRVEWSGVTCVVGMGIDISERLQAYEALRRSEERYRTTLERILEGCQLLDFSYRYLYLNPTAAVQNQRPNSELLGRTMLECWPGIENTDVFAMIKRCMERRVGEHQEVEFVFPSGVRGCFDVRVQPVPEGTFILSIDISDRKRAELALRDLNENLEIKVAERTSDLKEARERAESADRLKSAFLATMSHELRTPLNSILGFTGMLLEGYPGPLNPEQQKQLGMVQNSAKHLLDLINDVLDVSKIEAGELGVRFGDFDLRSSLERLAVSMKPLAVKKGLELRVSIAPEIQQLHSDRRRVEQIVLNLANNAIKFTQHGSVTLSAERVGDFVRIAVADTGMGIKSQDLGTLFVPFRQLDIGLERHHEGTGLGLVISRRLTELLGGEIEVESRWGEGSRFEISLPLRREASCKRRSS